MNTCPPPRSRSPFQARTARCSVGYEPGKPSSINVSKRRCPLRRSRSGFLESSLNSSSSRAAHGPITGKRFARGPYFGRVTSLLRYFLTVLRDAPPPRDLTEAQLLDPMPAPDLAYRLHA